MEYSKTNRESSVLDYYKDNDFSFNSKNIRSFQPKDAQAQHDRTAIRYHYTSSSALMAILRCNNNKTGVLRFTDARYLNDRSEHLFFVKRLLEYMDRNKRNYQFCQEVINELLLRKHTKDDYINLRVSEIDNIEYRELTNKKPRHFLFCLCKESDSLHMWNYYVHNENYQGYNIGIRIYDFLKDFDYESKNSDPIRFYCGDVLYKKSKQESEIEELCNQIEEFVVDFGYDSETLQLGMLRLWLYIESFGLFYKDECFSDEQEYRIVIQFREDVAKTTISTYFNENNRDFKYDYFERNGLIVPYLSVPISRDSIKQITMAPMLENHIASVSLNDFLMTNGYYDVDVKQSSIPVRY